MRSGSADGGQAIALLGSVLALVVVAAGGIAVASPDLGSPKVTYSGTSEPAPTGEPAAATTDEDEADGIARANLTYLRATLGDAFVIEGGQLVAHSAEGLPPGLSALGTVTVLPYDGQPFACPAAPEPHGSCTENELPDGTKDILETAGVLHSAEGSSFGAITVRYQRANRETVIVALSVLGKLPGGSTSDVEDAVRSWLKAQHEKLLAAAQDDRLAVSPD
ncbi:MAG TPA: hypothetical protein VNC22_19160 [Sporichthya sp.]|nr:hypothetical protein [Sporichthya sp.]